MEARQEIQEEINTNMDDFYKALDWLKRFYHFILMYTKEGKPAKDYLLNRNITEETMRKYSIGYVPANTKYTLVFLKSKGFSYRDLVNKKILHRYRNGQLTTLFRDRIVFPIPDYQNNTVGFGGRLLSKKDDLPKYINSEESNLFQRKDCLFGFDLAKEDIQNQGYAILLEGYFDVLTASQNGVKNTVASLGTALTINQALLLKSVTKNIVIAYDGDKAGNENSFHATALLDEIGCNVRIACFPNDLDPDELIISEGVDSFMEIVKEAQPIVAAFMNYKKNDYNLLDPISRYEYTDEVLKFILNSNFNEREALNKLQEVLGVSLETINNEVKRFLGT